MIRITEEASEQVLVVKIQTGTDRNTGGEGYYYIYPDRSKSSVTKEIWNDLKVTLNHGAMHFPSYREAEEWVNDNIKDEYGIDVVIESVR